MIWVQVCVFLAWVVEPICQFECVRVMIADSAAEVFWWTGSFFCRNGELLSIVFVFVMDIVHLHCN